LSGRTVSLGAALLVDGGGCVWCRRPPLEMVRAFRYTHVSLAYLSRVLTRRPVHISNRSNFMYQDKHGSPRSASTRSSPSGSCCFFSYLVILILWGCSVKPQSMCVLALWPPFESLAQRRKRRKRHHGAGLRSRDWYQLSNRQWKGPTQMPQTLMQPGRCAHVHFAGRRQ
jgi:hypothetical protein